MMIAKINWAEDVSKEEQEEWVALENSLNCAVEEWFPGYFPTETKYHLWRDDFAAAMDPRLYSIEHLDGLIFDGKARLLTSTNAAIVIEVRTFPTGARAVAGVIAAGDATEITDILIPRAEQWGRENGCAFGLIESRPGWQKLLPDYQTFQVSIIKEL